MPRITVDGKLTEVLDCPQCGRTVFAAGAAGYGFLTACGRRLINLLECNPLKCTGEPKERPAGMLNAAEPGGCFDWTPNDKRCPQHREPKPRRARTRKPRQRGRFV